jgi:hypothetical protein
MRKPKQVLSGAEIGLKREQLPKAAVKPSKGEETIELGILKGIQIDAVLRSHTLMDCGSPRQSGRSAARPSTAASWRAQRGHPSSRYAVMDCHAALAVTGVLLFAVTETLSRSDGNFHSL